MICSNCGKYFNDDFDFCPYCGTKAPSPKICPQCGRKSFEYEFCPKCGIKLLKEEEIIEKAKRYENSEKNNAIKYYKKALEVNPNNTKYINKLKELHGKQEAIQEYQKSIKLEEEGIYEKAITALNKAIKLDPNIKYEIELERLEKEYSKEKYIEAMQLEEQKSYEKAITALNKAIELDPDNDTYKNKVEELKIRERKDYETKFKYITDLISSGKKEITLTNDIILNPDDESYFNGMRINLNNITIDGDGHTINAKNNGKIFDISSKNIIIKNIHLENSESEAIYIESNSDVTLINCTFSNNSHKGNLLAKSGGAIINKGQLKIIDSTFNKNKSDNGGAISNYGSLIIENSKFENNQATNSIAGAIYNHSNAELRITNSIFNHNIAKNFAGAITNHKNAKLTILNSKFNNNQAQKYGGAIVNESGILNAKKCEFTENTAQNNGAIANKKGVFSKLVEIEVKNCKFKNNKPNDEY